MAEKLKVVITSPTVRYSHQSEKNSIKIGRSSDCDLMVPKEDLSREHCLLERQQGKYFITDLGSKNGVWVDRKRILPNKKVEVTPQSLIILANLYTLKINQEIAHPFKEVTRTNTDLNDLTMTFDFNSFEEEKKKK